MIKGDDDPSWLADRSDDRSVRRGMSSSYQSLLSLSPVDWIGASDHFDGGDVSSHLSFDTGGGYCNRHHRPEAAAGSNEGELGRPSQASALSSEGHDRQVLLLITKLSIKALE